MSAELNGAGRDGRCDTCSVTASPCEIRGDPRLRAEERDRSADTAAVSTIAMNVTEFRDVPTATTAHPGSGPVEVTWRVEPRNSCPQRSGEGRWPARRNACTWFWLPWGSRH